MSAELAWLVGVAPEQLVPVAEGDLARVVNLIDRTLRVAHSTVDYELLRFSQVGRTAVSRAVKDVTRDAFMEGGALRSSLSAVRGRLDALPTGAVGPSATVEIAPRRQREHLVAKMHTQGGLF